MPGHDLLVPPGLPLPDRPTLPRDAVDDAVDAFAASARSAATRRADARDLVAWCAEQRVLAEPRTVKRYLADLAARALSVILGWALYHKGDWDGARQVFSGLDGGSYSRERQEGLRVIQEAYIPPRLR